MLFDLSGQPSVQHHLALLTCSVVEADAGWTGAQSISTPAWAIADVAALQRSTIAVCSAVPGSGSRPVGTV